MLVISNVSLYLQSGAWLVLPDCISLFCGHLLQLASITKVATQIMVENKVEWGKDYHQNLFYFSLPQCWLL